VGDYQLYRLDGDGPRTKVIELRAESDGAAMGDALRQTDNGATYVFCEGEREIAVIEVNDNRFLFADHDPPRIRRPVTIRCFEFLFIAALAVGIIHVLIGWRDLSGQLPGGFQIIFAVLFALTNCLFLTLCLLISRRRSVVSMWLLLAIFAVGGLITLRHILDGQVAGSTPVSVAQFSVELVALSLLFMPASRFWMRYRY
jgi:hypothetical protein